MYNCRQGSGEKEGHRQVVGGRWWSIAAPIPTSMIYRSASTTRPSARAWGWSQTTLCVGCWQLGSQVVLYLALRDRQLGWNRQRRRRRLGLPCGSAVGEKGNYYSLSSIEPLVH